jgi:hypothetical protein
MAENVEFSGAVKSGANVDTLCTLHARECGFHRNGHYGVQAKPKATIILTDCTLSGNRRGDSSGNGIRRNDV